MPRITVHNDPGCLTLQLERRLAGAWVRVRAVLAEITHSPSGGAQEGECSDG
jgi:hypothetical protein